MINRKKLVEKHPLLHPDTETVLIGVTGVARAGKDTIADILAEAISFERYSIAKPIKDMIAAGLGLKDKEDAKAEELFGCSYRHIAQTLGTDWGRNMVTKKIWLNIAKARCKNRAVIISDIRFNDEAEWIREHGVLIHVIRGGHREIEENKHESEDGVDTLHGDYKILNDKEGDLEGFKNLIRSHVVNDIRVMLEHRADWKDLEEST